MSWLATVLLLLVCCAPSYLLWLCGDADDPAASEGEAGAVGSRGSR